MRFSPQYPAIILFIGALVLIETAQAKSTSASDSLSLAEIKKQTAAISSVTSLLIQQNDRLLAEYYFQGMQQSEATNIKSASKSIISLLVGIAIEENMLQGIEQPIRPFFEDYFQANPDPIKENITMKNLLTMRAGLETTSFHNYGQWVISDNWAKFALDQPIEKQPSGEMIYSTGSSHLLSIILSKAAQMSTKSFAEKYLFKPMDIQPGGWDRDPQGYYMGGNNLALRPTDMLKIGQLVLNGGTYQGKRIISKNWLRKSFRTYTRSNYNPYDYGFMWWKKLVGDYQVHFAWGYGGQYIFMIPELKAVFVMTGKLSSATQSRSYRGPVFTLIRKKIIPFLETEIKLEY